MAAHIKLLLVILLFVLSYTQVISIESGADLTETVKQQMREGALDAINIYRELHGVPALVLDGNLTEQAQIHAEYIKSMQDPEEKSAGHGVGYWESNFWNLKIPTYEHRIGEIVEQWYGENLNYNYETGAKIEEDLPVDHFTALVWKSCTSVGIGFAGGVEDYFGMEGVGLYAVMQFSPAANVEGGYLENVLAAVEPEAVPVQEPALTQEPVPAEEPALIPAN